MGVPLLFGAREGVQRSGEKFRGKCPRCETVRVFYRAKETLSVSLFYAVSLWDSAKDVVQCGECMATFEPTGVPPLPDESKTPLTDHVTRALGISREKPAPSAASGRPASSLVTKARARDVDAEIDAELAAMKRRLGS